MALFRKHGITAKQPYKKPDANFWPDQVLMDGVACLAVGSPTARVPPGAAATEVVAKVRGAADAVCRPKPQSARLLVAFPGETATEGAETLRMVTVMVRSILRTVRRRPRDPRRSRPKSTHSQS